MANWKIGVKFNLGGHAMKKSIVTMIFAVLPAALSFTSCLKETPEDGNGNLPAGPVFHFSSQLEEPKSVFGEPYTEGGRTKYPVYWSGNENKVMVSPNYASSSGSKSVALSVTPGTKYATFDYTYEGSDYPVQFVVLSPYFSYSNASKASKRVTVDILPGQTPTDDSPDENTQVLVAVSDAYAEDDIPDRISMNFKHVPAYMLLSFTNVDLGTGAAKASVQSVSITASKSGDPYGISGRIYFFPENEETPFSNPGNMTSTITVNTSLLTDPLNNVWFTFAPTDLSEVTLKFDIYTDKGQITKEITMSDDRQLVPGKIYKMTVNMSGADTKDNVIFRRLNLKADDDPEGTYDTLGDGDEIIIVAVNGDYALSTSQNQNNRAAAGIVKTGDLVINPPDNVEVITVDAVAGGYYEWMAQSTSSYFYAPSTESSGSNLLRIRTPNTDDGYGTWTIKGANYSTIHSAFIQRKNLTSTYHSRVGFNPDEILFTAYNNTSTFNNSGRWVDIYRKVGATGLDAELSTLSVDGQAQDIALYIFCDNIDWTASVSGGGSFKGSGLTTSSGSNSSALAIHLPANTESSPSKTHTITVSADGYSDIVLDLTQTVKEAVFPVQWSMPAEYNIEGVDYARNKYTGSYVYSDTHEGKMSVIRVSTDQATSSATTYILRDEDRWNGKYCLLHYGVYKEDYWLFEVYNVNNPAGTYTLDYKMESSNNGPKYFLLEYSLDNGANWTAFPGYSTTPYDPDGDVQYHYALTGGTPAAITQNVTLGAVAGTLSLRARVTSTSRTTGSQMPVNHGASNRVGDHVTISFTAD